MKTKRIFILIMLIVLAASAGLVAYQANRDSQDTVSTIISTDSSENTTVELQTKTIVGGLNKPWDIAFIDENDIIYTEREGRMTRYSNGQKYEITGLPEINAGGEGGLLGLVTDPAFESNRYIYACYNTTEDIRVSRWMLQDDELQDKTDIVTGMPINTTTYPNRHSGCRLAYDDEEVLWVGTGDVAESVHPQDPSSLGGKILRIDRDGNPAPGNLSDPFDPRIYSYGHRNVQGIALTRGGETFDGLSVQHGPDRDDEINVLQSGNFGWDPGPNYDENVPMTDLDAFPDAIEAVWSSGKPTLAPSGATFIYGDGWGDVSGNLFVAMQKTKHIRMFTVENDGAISSETELFKDEFGRIRTVVQAPNGSVYFATDNGGSEDKIVQIIPR